MKQIMCTVDSFYSDKETSHDKKVNQFKRQGFGRVHCIYDSQVIQRVTLLTIIQAVLNGLTFSCSDIFERMCISY